MPFINVKISRLAIIVLISLAINMTFGFSAAGSSAGLPAEGFRRQQLRNYIEQEARLTRLIELVFPRMEDSQKVCWRMLLLGTLAVETNFLNEYYGRSKNGNGPFQITGRTAYGIIHSYASYPLKASSEIATRDDVVKLFAAATEGRITWQALTMMSVEDLRNLCVNDHDFAGLASILVYRDMFERNGVEALPANPSELASLWKRYYNTEHGIGTEKRFIERFNKWWGHA